MSEQKESTAFRLKVAMRSRWLAEQQGPVRVLDAFHGHGAIWQAVVDEVPDADVSVLGVEKNDYHQPGVLVMDNRRALRALDLNPFDLDDLDAFGWPVQQLATVAARAPGTPVFVTWISATMGRVPNVVQQASDIPVEWEFPQTLLNKQRAHLWWRWVGTLGYTSAAGYTLTSAILTKWYGLIR